MTLKLKEFVEISDMKSLKSVSWQCYRKKDFFMMNIIGSIAPAIA